MSSPRILRGRHVGPWLGQEPTGRRVALRIMDFLRFEDGRIIEHWSALRPADSGDDEEASTAAGSCVPLYGDRVPGPGVADRDDRCRGSAAHHLDFEPEPLHDPARLPGSGTGILPGPRAAV